MLTTTGLLMMPDHNIEFIEQLFNAISNDPTMPADLKVSLLRLQLPMHKISQSDDHFIINDKHPARRTLLILKRLSHHARSDTRLVSKIDHIIDQLTKSSISANAFTSTNQRLEQLIEQTESRDTETVAKPQKSSADLKTYLNDKIRLCIHGQQIPESAKLLTLKLWPSALFHVLKSHGDKTRHWNNAMEMFCELVDSLQPLQNIEDYRKLKDNYMRIARTHNNMMLLYHNESTVESAIKSLITHYNTVLGKSNYGQALNNMSRISVLDKISSLPDNIKPGVWCEIFIDDATPKRRLRLSYISIESGTLIFVNRNGIKKLEKDALEFSTELKKGLSRVYRHDELFNATSTATSKEQSNGKRYKKIS